MHTMLKFATYMGPHGKHMRILSMKASARWDENLKYNWKVTGQSLSTCNFKFNGLGG